MTSDPLAGTEFLRDSAERGARLVALDLLGVVRAARERLDDIADREALHDFRVALRRLRSWTRAFRPVLRDTLGKKTERRLKRLAHATSESRDLEVHIDWLVRARRSLPPTARPGATWLLARLRRDKRAADAAFRAEIDADFDQAMERTQEALSHFVATVAEGPRFGAVAADFLDDHAIACREALRSARQSADRTEAHAGRISAKRLRYLLEPFGEVVRRAAVTIAELKRVQDMLGELHDALVFGSRLAGAIAEASTARELARRRARRVTAKAGRGRTRNPIPGLRLLSRRLHSTAETCLATVSESLVDTMDAELATSIGDVVASLRGAASAGGLPGGSSAG